MPAATAGAGRLPAGRTGSFLGRGGAMGLLVSLLVLGVLGIVLLALCWLCGIWPFGPAEPWGLHTARFATNRELRHLTSKTAPADGLLLCRDKRKSFIAV